MLVLRLLLVGCALMVAACGGDDSPPATAAPGNGTSTPATANQSPSASVTVPGLATDTPTRPPQQFPPDVTFTEIADGFARPTFVTHAGDGSGRLFVLEKEGFIRIVEEGQVLEEPFLDVREQVTGSGNEQGLLGLAFHPDYPQDPRFWIAYTASGDGANTLAEYRVSGDPNLADASSGRVVLAIPDPAANHNGGMVAFGPDGYLYLSTGDGGSGQDATGQDLGTLAAKILRLDVDGEFPYEVPADNPFVGVDGARPETWAYGLRNPWRFSFDSENGDLWIADVGQNAWEEINYQPAASNGGENYGWSVMEGSYCYRPSNGCDTGGKVLPLFEYDHSGGCSVTGGYVYRGSLIPVLDGLYLFTDYCAGAIGVLDPTGLVAPLGLILESVSSFGQDEDGEIYAVTDRGGTLYQLVPVSPGQ